MDAADLFGIRSKQQIAHWLAQMAHESNGFLVTRESLNYSAAGLLKTFGRHRISEEDCYKFGRGQDKPAHQAGIANAVYGGEWGAKYLGNIEPGDGWRFVGRGFLQVTGRANYTECGEAIDMDLIESPEFLEDNEGASLSAGWFWKKNRLNYLADKDDITGITRRINGGLLGLADRQNWLKKFKDAL